MNKKVIFQLFSLSFILLLISCDKSSKDNHVDKNDGIKVENLDSIPESNDIVLQDESFEYESDFDEPWDGYDDEDLNYNPGNATNSDIFYPGRINVKGSYTNRPIDFTGYFVLGEKQYDSKRDKYFYKGNGQVNYSHHGLYNEKRERFDSIIVKDINNATIEINPYSYRVIWPGYYGMIYLEKVPKNGSISRGNDFYRDEMIYVEAEFSR